MRRSWVQSISWKHGRNSIKFKLLFLHFCGVPFHSPSSMAYGRLQVQFKEHVKQDAMREYKGDGITYKLSSESKGDWKSWMSQKSWALSNLLGLKRTCLLLVQVLETIHSFFSFLLEDEVCSLPVKTRMHSQTTHLMTPSRGVRSGSFTVAFTAFSVSAVTLIITTMQATIQISTLGQMMQFWYKLIIEHLNVHFKGECCTGKIYKF